MFKQHIEKIRGKSEDFKIIYSLGVSILFTGIVAGVWVFSWLIPDYTMANSASVSNAIDGSVSDSNDISPTRVVGQQLGGVFGSFVDSVKLVVSGSKIYKPEDSTLNTDVNVVDHTLNKTSDTNYANAEPVVENGGITVEAEDGSDTTATLDTDINSDIATSSESDNSDN